MHTHARAPYGTVQGELALKALEFAQTGMPMTALSAAFAPLRLPAHERDRLREVLYPWAWRAGSRCADLVSLDYEVGVVFYTSLDSLWTLIVDPWQLTHGLKGLLGFQIFTIE